MAMVKRQRRIEDKVTSETQYYISSLPNAAKRILQVARSHWGIENSLHWVLDVAMGEDDSRVRKGHAPENLALLRRVALALLKQEKTAKVGVKAKRHKAGWDENYLMKVLGVT
jgi:predicted transposase YbfD/YdcC